MPYIDPGDRLNYEDEVIQLVERLENQPIGHVNYVVSLLLWKLFDKNPSYTKANELHGVTGCVASEFYRRKVAPYEDQKMVENGDI